MKLYHYTSVKSFKKIWESQSLKFSDSKKANDLFKKRKLLEIHNVTFPIKYKPTSKNYPFIKHFYDILYNYRQISLCMDYNEDFKGYASPMMWGQYANCSKGVCIELDSDKLKLDPIYMKASKIEYLENVPKIVFDHCVFQNDNDILQFIESRANEIFFKKHFHWQFENEYRIISNQLHFLPINDAISAIYVPCNKGYAFRVVDEIIKGTEIKFRSLVQSTLKGNRRISYMDIESARRCQRQFEEKKTFAMSELLK